MQHKIQPLAKKLHEQQISDSGNYIIVSILL